MQIVKVIAKVVDDNSGIFTEIPVLLDQDKEPIKPLVEYALKLKRDGMSPSTTNNYIKSTQLLLEYMTANVSAFSSPQALFESFSSRLYTGTIGDDGLPSDIEALKDAIDENKMAQLGWTVSKYGAVKDEYERPLFKTGFVLAIKKILDQF